MRKRVGLLWAASMGLALCLGFAPLSSQGAKPSGGGAQACATCHKDTVEAFKHTPHSHSVQSCEGCHGDASAHIAGGGDTTKIRSIKKMTPQESSAVCLTCHEKGNALHWKGSAHDSRNMACTECHNVHPAQGKMTKSMLVKPQFELCTTCHLQKKAALMRSGHMPMREGKMQCTTCHNPHGTPFEKQLLQTSVNENCYSCHAEKRGPFLYEHPPVRENCLNCHDAHGSIHDNLLKIKQPLLCQQCHIGTRHPGQMHVRDRYAFAQGCINCHPKVHGSTHPTGNRFWR